MNFPNTSTNASATTTVRLLVTKFKRSFDSKKQIETVALDCIQNIDQELISWSNQFKFFKILQCDIEARAENVSSTASHCTAAIVDNHILFAKHGSDEKQRALANATKSNLLFKQIRLLPGQSEYFTLNCLYNDCPPTATANGPFDPRFRVVITSNTDSPTYIEGCVFLTILMYN